MIIVQDKETKCILAHPLPLSHNVFLSFNLTHIVHFNTLWHQSKKWLFKRLMHFCFLLNDSLPQHITAGTEALWSCLFKKKKLSPSHHSLPTSSPSPRFHPLVYKSDSYLHPVNGTRPGQHIGIASPEGQREQTARRRRPSSASLSYGNGSK